MLPKIYHKTSHWCFFKYKRKSIKHFKSGSKGTVMKERSLQQISKECSLIYELDSNTSSAIFLKFLEVVKMQFMNPFETSVLWNGLKRQNKIKYIK